LHTAHIFQTHSMLTRAQDAKGTQQYQGDPDSPDSINDVKFTLELLDHIQERYCIDKTQIWAAGKSNGGGFTGILACDPEATKRIAAFAPVSGAFYLNKDNKVPDCKPIPSRMPIPIMEFHGWEDKTILYEGGDNSRKNRQTRNIVSWVDDWAKRDGFKVDANKTSTLCEGGKKVTRYSWNDVVVHYNYTNVAHDWPSSTPNLDTGDSNDAKDLLTCKEAEATSIILAWFKKWTLKKE
jgi:poly(3-hydroxybutyrate) depolymerase